MSLSANRSQLAAITKALSMNWQQTEEYWRDAKSQEFKHEYLDELFDSVDSTVAVMDQLDKLLNKIRTDCE
jgi:hypothetical protein